MSYIDKRSSLLPNSRDYAKKFYYFGSRPVSAEDKLHHREKLQKTFSAIFQNYFFKLKFGEYHL